MSSKFTCRFCKEQFDQPKGLYKHLQSAHSAGSSTDNRTCPICGVLCSKYEGYRDHLLYIHGQSNEGQKLTFKSLNEFLLWKTELEIKYHCKYVLQSAPKVLSTKEKKYFYQCDASNPKTKDKKALSVVMKQCSSVISVVEGTGVFKVEYWDAHSGHVESAKMSVQNELEAAISSVEMVNAIGESDDSFDRSEEFSNPASFSAVEKQSFLKTHSPSSANNTRMSLVAPKSKSLQLTTKPGGEKKKAENMFRSLASVACGKGITKKPSNAVNASQKDANTSSVNSLKVPVKHDAEKLNKTVSTPVKNKNGSITLLSTSTKSIVEPTSAATIAISSASVETAKPKISAPKISLPKTTPTLKVSPSGPQAIAPKIATMNSNTMNSLFPSNSVFPNQLVIVNPVGLDPNSNPNVASAGQNLVFSLPLGQNILPATTASQLVTNTLDSPAATVSSIKSSKVVTSSINTSSVSRTSVKTAVNSIQTVANGTIPTPITMAPNMKNAPVVLSSLPVGSTFMSVNNNLIPIASPSGAFLPTSLPPNIVLTPVVSTMSSTHPTSQPTSVSSQIVQNQVCFSIPCTPSVTLSSVRREPIYSSTPMKQINSISTPSSISPILSTSPKTSKVPYKGKNKTKAITIAKLLSPSKPSVAPPSSIASTIAPILNKFAASGELSITATQLQKNYETKAKKRVAKNVAKSTALSSAVKTTAMTESARTVTNTVTNSANSQINLAPVNSIPNVTIPAEQLNNPNVGTFVFESSGEVFMLEPIENHSVQNYDPGKSILDSPKLKIDRSAQTFENLNLTTLMPSLQRKRAAGPDDDSIMMKVKCYQLEMQYLNSQTDCKRLKIELTKERLKNAELMGQKIDIQDNDRDDKPRNKAQEIMKEIEDKFSEKRDTHIYTMTKTTVLRSLYEDLEELCLENTELHKELENYRAHDKFYKSLKKKMYEEDFES